MASCSPDQKAYGFIADNLYIYAILSAEGKVVDITYFDNTAKRELPTAVTAKLWDLNVDKQRVWDWVWDDTFYRTIALSTGWDAKHVYKKLGDEPGKHSVMYEGIESARLWPRLEATITPRWPKSFFERLKTWRNGILAKTDRTS
jgi:hypothetical protein